MTFIFRAGDLDENHRSETIVKTKGTGYKKPKEAPPGPSATSRAARQRGERFSAMSDCPHCGEFGYHWIRKPRTPTEYDSMFGSISFGYYRAKMDDAYEESEFEVIRICRSCEGEWGQK